MTDAIADALNNDNNIRMEIKRGKGGDRVRWMDSYR